MIPGPKLDAIVAEEVMLKQIEKLAKKYADLRYISEEEGYASYPQDAFMAGFRKACEMAVRECNNYRLALKYSNLQPIPEALATEIMLSLGRLGELEVEE